jgi:hypothetical protein
MTRLLRYDGALQAKRYFNGERTMPDVGSRSSDSIVQPQQAVVARAVD